MRTSFSISFLLIITVLVYGCSQPSSLTPVDDILAPPPIETQQSGQGEIVGSTSLPTETIQPSESPTANPVTSLLSDITSYDLKTELDYSSKTLKVVENVLFKNTIGKPLRNFSFVVEPNRYSNGLNLIKAEVSNLPVTLTNSLEGNQLFVSVDPAISDGESVMFSFEFELVLPQIPPPSEQYKPQPYGYTERQINLVDWYLFLPPLNDNGEWVIHEPSYFGEFLVYPTADFHVELHIVNNQTPLMVAASANNLSLDDSKYEYDLHGARTFAISVNNNYEVVEREVNGVAIRSYFYFYDRGAGEAALDATANALDLYSDLFGPYPHVSLSVVEADFLDGMEFDGLYFLSRGFYNLYDGTPKGYLTMIAVHETAHQWWFGQVGNDQAMQPWLDEGWCTFSELLYYENYFPELVDWWWYFRVNYYKPTGFINLPVYDYSGFTPYRNAVYLRGAQFLYDLRTSLGNEEFLKSTKAYLQKFNRELATTKDFFTIFGLNGDNYQELLSEYFKHAED